MAPTLVLEAAEGSLPLDHEGHLAKSSQLRQLLGHQLELEAQTLGKLAVHLEQVRCKQTGLVSTGASADLDDHIPVVVLIGGQQLGLDLFE